MFRLKGLGDVRLARVFPWLLGTMLRYLVVSSKMATAEKDEQRDKQVEEDDEPDEWCGLS